MRDRDAAFDRVLETVKSIQLVLDTEMQGITLALEVLANSRALQNDDLDGFRSNADAFLRRYPASVDFACEPRRHTSCQHRRAAGPAGTAALNREVDRAGVRDRQAGLFGYVHRLGAPAAASSP